MCTNNSAHKQSIKITPCRTKPRQRGISLVELIIFILIISIALVGLLLVLNITTKASADPLMHKQALAIAESMIEEISLHDFQNPDGFTGPAIQTNRPLFDDVFDFDGFATVGAFPANGSSTPIAGLEGYEVRVDVVKNAWGSVLETNVAQITVTVKAPDGQSVQTQAYRLNY